jgi:Na+-translocating ferredoxin:NAD+ oxidoreductase subunit B
MDEIARRLADRIDATLPQTQCTRCGYPACRPYAEAIALGEAQINRCPPGGTGGIERIAALTGRDPILLDPACGAEKPVETVARVVEKDCIGCTKCIQACPVDAIIGAPSLMHSIIESECTGCELCIPPCPVDCIVMVPAPSAPPAFNRAVQFKARYDARNLRLADLAGRQNESRASAKKADAVAAALARARASRSGSP